MTKVEEKAILKKMELVLFSYNKYIDRIKKCLEMLKNPILANTYSLESIKGSGYVEVKSELEKIEELKRNISDDISRYEAMLFRIDSALDMVKDDKNYNFIDMRYMQGLTYEKIAEKLNISTQRAYRIRNDILRALEIHFKVQNFI